LFSKATQEYEHYNDVLKKELPLFFDYMIQFIEPILESFYHIQLKIFEKSLRRMEKVVEKSDFDTDSPIVDLYDERVEDAKNQIESLTLLNRDAKLTKFNPEICKLFFIIFIIIHLIDCFKFHFIIFFFF
jgi:amphiphysin